MKTVFYTADVSALADERLFQAAYRAVPPERQAKADRLRLPEDKRLSLGAALLLRHALSEAGITGEPRFAVRGEGKPCLDRETGVCLNLSHSGTVAACAVSPYEIGCDVEKIGGGGLPLARRFFHPAEIELLAAAAPEEQQLLFCRLWTLKESFVKATAEGLRLPLSSFEIRFSENGVLPVSRDGHDYFFRELTGVPGYCAALCTRDGDAGAEHRTVDLAALPGMR